MREFSTPPLAVDSTRTNVSDDVMRWAVEQPDRVLFSRRGEGEWEDVGAAEFVAEVRSVAKGLIAAGIEPGDRVALWSATRYEWAVLDYAIWFAGAISVPIYESSSTEQARWILANSGARALICERPAHLAHLAQVRSELPELIHVWSLGDNAIGVLNRLGGDLTDSQVEERRTALGRDDAATIIYTSGTTGQPKGCTLTHGNLLAGVASAVSEEPELFDAEAAATLLFLPLAHVFARIIQLGTVRSGVRLGHTSDVASLAELLGEFQPTFLLAVPRVFEKLYNTASQRAVADGKGKVFERATSVAIAYSRALDAGRVPLRLRAEHGVFDRLVFAKMRAALGSKCAYAVSGGAPLGERLAHFFRGAGVVIVEGYGMTEGSGALCANTPTALKIGTVGRPLPGVSVRVAADGELLIRGDQVFAGYWRDPESTESLLQADWLQTGDLGEIDEEGFVKITGRKKELLVTAGGKNVSPTFLEDRLRAHALVDNCLVVGDGQPFIAALVTIDREAATAWAESRGLDTKWERLAHHPDLRAELQRAVDHANQGVSQAEAIRRFAVLGVEWTEEGGQLTPSLKLKRQTVMRAHRDDVAGLYAR
ncbi:MAG: AMP-dependent synthetase/ligase [Nocardioides sp.]